MASSRFDTAWATSDARLAAEMGEVIFIGTARLEEVVVSEVEAGRFKAGPVVSGGVDFEVYLSRAQIEVLRLDAPEKGALSLQGKVVKREAAGMEGRVLSVQDLGGAGAVLRVGSAPSR